HSDRDGGLSGLLDELRRHHRLAGIIIERLGMNEALGTHHLTNDATHAHLSAVGAAQDEAPRSADLEVAFADSERKPAWAEPALEELASRERVEDHRARRVEHAHHLDLAIRGRGDLECTGVEHEKAGVEGWWIGPWELSVCSSLGRPPFCASGLRL